MIRYRPAAVSSRDGHGHAFSVEVAARLRHVVPILAPDGSLVGECMPDGTAFWDPPLRPGSKIAPVSVRQALATNGRLTASVDESGVVLCLRAEYRRRIETRSKHATATSAGKSRKSYSAPDDEWINERIEYSVHPGRIISVGGLPVRGGNHGR